MSNTPTLGIPTPITKHGFCHPLIRKTAIEFTESIYERLAKNNVWYEAHRDRKAWVGAKWKDMIPQVRKTLAKMLAMPQYDKKTKDEIAEALIQDNQFRLGRMRGLMRRAHEG